MRRIAFSQRGKSTSLIRISSLIGKERSLQRTRRAIPFTAPFRPHTSRLDLKLEWKQSRRSTIPTATPSMARRAHPRRIQTRQKSYPARRDYSGYPLGDDGRIFRCGVREIYWSVGQCETGMVEVNFGEMRQGLQISLVFVLFFLLKNCLETDGIALRHRITLYLLFTRFDAFHHSTNSLRSTPRLVTAPPLAHSDPIALAISPPRRQFPYEARTRQCANLLHRQSTRPHRILSRSR